MGVRHSRIAACLLAGSMSGCVNNYVVDAGSSTSTGGPGSSTTSEGDSTSGSSAGVSSSSSGASSSGMPTEPLALCEGPCVSDDDCGDEPDLCVRLGDNGPLMCLARCGELAGECPVGFTCQERASVDGDSREQCVPTGDVCP